MKCLNCLEETTNPKFCSRHCSTIYNNKIHPKRKPEHHCKMCSCLIISSKSYCSDECKIKAKELLKKKTIFIIDNITRYKRNDSEIFCENSKVARVVVKRRYLKSNRNICSICGQLPEWLNKKLVMVLDHINGIKNDNRLVNLRLLCPNCNSQTATFSGRNVSKLKNRDS
jgi:predicted nucleic acid-binding Zn ribbon protein